MPEARHISVQLSKWREQFILGGKTALAQRRNSNSGDEEIQFCDGAGQIPQAPVIQSDGNQVEFCLRVLLRCTIKHQELKLSDRIYHCDTCKHTMDRDLNAAINIRNMGLIKVGRGTPEFTPAEIGALPVQQQHRHFQPCTLYIG